MSESFLDFAKRNLNCRIVSSNDLSYFQISEAQACQRFWVDGDTGYGWAALPWDLTTDKDNMRHSKHTATGELAEDETT